MRIRIDDYGLLAAIVVTVVFISANQCFADLFLDPDLIARWPLDDGSGQTASGTSNNNHELQLGGTSGTDAEDPTWATRGMDFDGSDYLTSVTDKDDFDFDADEPFSVAGWLKPGTSINQQMLFSKMDTTGAYPGWFIAWRGNVDQLEFFMRDDAGGNGDGRLHVQSVTIHQTDWFHVAVTYNGTATIGGVKIYVDGGDPLGVAASSNSLASNATTNNSAPLNLGGRNDSGFYVGRIDDVAIWSRELSKAEVGSLVPEPSTFALLTLGCLVLSAGSSRLRKTRS